MITIAFLAQNLDNVSANHIVVEGVTLPPNDPQRQEITKLVSDVSLRGAKVEGDGFALYVFGSAFVIRAIPQEKDNVGRISPILCYGLFPETPSDSWVLDLIENFERFANEINRNFPDGMISNISNLVRQEIAYGGSKKNDYPLAYNLFINTSARLHNLFSIFSNKIRRIQ